MSINTPSEDATLQMYEKFLDFIEEVIDTELSMDVRNKNYNLFKTYFESHPTLNVLLAGLQKKHNILGVYDGKMLHGVLDKRKKDIISGEVFLFPLNIRQMGEGDYSVEHIILLEKKDFFGPMGERIKGILSGEQKGTVGAEG